MAGVWVLFHVPLHATLAFQGTKRRRRGPRGDVTRASIIAAADRVLRSGGLAGLTLRSVAREAGIAPNAIYTYVASMADLRNALGDAFLAGLDTELLRSAGPQEALRRFLDHVLATFAQCPRPRWRSSPANA